MTIRGHVLLAVPIAYVVCQAVPGFDTGPTMFYAFGALIGVLLPDIDEPESYIGQHFYIVANLIKTLNRHRGITHSIWAILAPFLVAVILNDYFIFGLAVGVGAHIAGDMLTNTGVKGFLTPFYHGRVALLPERFRFPTGGIFEQFFILVLLVFELVFIFQSLSSGFQ